MQGLDKNRLKNVASADPDVDIEDFNEFYQANVGEAGDSINLDTGSTGNDEQVWKFNDFKNNDFDIMPDRATKSRPGMGSKLIGVGHGTGDEEDEVYRADSIDLDTYQKMSVDAQIAFGTYLFKGWIASLPYTIECPDEHLRNIIDYIVGRVYKSVIRNIVTTGFKFGFSFGEKIWNRESVILTEPNDRGETEIIYEGIVTSLEKIKFLDPRHSFSFFVDSSDEISRVEQVQIREDGRHDVSVGRKKLLWFALDKEFSNVFGRARYKNIYPEWYYSKINNQLQINDLQKRGSPHIEVRYPRGKSQVDGEMVKNRVVAMKIAEEMMSEGVAAFPSEAHENGDSKWSLKYADTQRGSNSDSPFLEYLRYQDQRKMKGMGIPPAIAESDSNFSNVDASGDMLAVIIEDVVDQIETVIEDDVVNPAIENNFGPRKKSLVNFKVEKSALGRRGLMKEILKTMLRTGSDMKGQTLKSWPNVVSILRDLGISQSSFQDVFTDKMGNSADRGEDSIIDEQEDIEDSNDTSGGGTRISEDDRDRERSSKRDDARES